MLKKINNQISIFVIKDLKTGKYFRDYGKWVGPEENMRVFNMKNHTASAMEILTDPNSDHDCKPVVEELVYSLDIRRIVTNANSQRLKRKN